MSAKETTIIDDSGKQYIKETEITVTITLPNDKGLFCLKIPASEGVRIVSQIYGQIGENGFVSRTGQEQYTKHFAKKEGAG